MATNNTNENLKKMFYSGVGFVSHSREILQKSADEISKHGKVSEAEGKKIIDGAMQKLEAGYNEAVHKLSALSATEIGKLKSRIDKMEKQLSTKQMAKKAPAAVKKVAKAVTGKKKAAKKK